MTNDLILREDLTPAVIYGNPQVVDDVIAQIREEASKVGTDVSTEEGRAAIRSMSYKIARSKTALDSMGKELTESWRESTKRVNDERKRITAALDVLQEETRRPLTEYESREQQRVDGFENRIVAMRQIADDANTAALADLDEMERTITCMMQEDWQEFQMRAGAQSAMTLERIALRRKAIADAEELARLREAERQRQAEEEKRRIEEAAAARARKEAEEKAAAEMEAAKKAAEAMVREAEEQAAAERRAIEEKAEQDAKAAAEEEERLQREANEANARAERYKKEREEADARAQEAIRQAEQAAQQERERVEAEHAAKAKAEAEEDRKRQADVEHRHDIDTQALTALVNLVGSFEGQPLETVAWQVIEAIKNGDIPYVTMNY